MPHIVVTNGVLAIWVITLFAGAALCVFAWISVSKFHYKKVFVAGFLLIISALATYVFVFENPNTITGQMYLWQPPTRVFIASVGLEGTMVSMDPIQESATVSFGPNKTSIVGLQDLSCPKGTAFFSQAGGCVENFKMGSYPPAR